MALRLWSDDPPEGPYPRAMRRLVLCDVAGCKETFEDDGPCFVSFVSEATKTGWKHATELGTLCPAHSGKTERQGDLFEELTA